jgi:mannose-6-phosphate isomerase
VIRVDGVLRPYAWGRIDGLSAWTPATGGPQAELWYGALGGAPDAPSHPLLTKFLAAATPLSIQVHPSAALVEKLWADESHGRGLLTDQVEKTELLLALEPFTSFAGFRDSETTARLLQGIGLHDVAEIASSGDSVATMQALLAVSEIAVDEAFRRLSDVIHPILPAHERSAIELVRAWYPHDRGALVALCLAVHELSPGDVIHVPAGVVHSYVNGLGVEVMTASDNVLRLGLTAKTIAVAEALEAINGTTPTVLRLQSATGASVYFADDSPFLVARLADSRWSIPPHTSATVLAIEGGCTVNTNAGDDVVAAGQALLLSPGDGGAEVVAPGLAVVALSNP